MRKVNAQGCLFPAHDVQTRGSEQRFGEAGGLGATWDPAGTWDLGPGATQTIVGPTAGGEEFADMLPALAALG